MGEEGINGTVALRFHAQLLSCSLAFVVSKEQTLTSLRQPSQKMRTDLVPAIVDFGILEEVAAAVVGIVFFVVFHDADLRRDFNLRPVIFEWEENKVGLITSCAPSTIYNTLSMVTVGHRDIFDIKVPVKIP